MFAKAQQRQVGDAFIELGLFGRQVDALERDTVLRKVHDTCVCQLFAASWARVRAEYSFVY